MVNSRVFSTVLVFWLSWHYYVVESQPGIYEGSVPGANERLPLLSASRTNFPQNQRCSSFRLPKLGLVFQGVQYRRIWVCKNGLLRFKNRIYQRLPRNFGTYFRQRTDPCLAPYWSLVDLDSFTSGNSSVSYYRVGRSQNDPDLFKKASEYGEKLLGGVYDTLWVAVITWQDVSPYNPGNFGGKNTFEVLLANSANDEAIAVYRYHDIDWSVRALRVNYRNFQGASYLPVVGWNSGNLFAPTPFWNFPSSGTVRIGDIDDHDDSVLDLGELGFSLSGGIAPSPCIQWINQQYLRGIGRINCREPCAPTYNEAFNVLRSRWRYLYKRIKFSTESPFYSNCVFSYYRGYNPNLRAVECCYHPFSGRLLDSPKAGAGRSHRYHPTRDQFYNPDLYGEEEAAYGTCCYTGNSNYCELFYSLRPPCTSFDWQRRKKRGRWASAFGEPHFVTLDSKNYTFNGCGWYTYFKGEIPGMSESKLDIQVRTTRVGDVNATGFTAIAMKEGNTEVVQVNLNSAGDLQIEVNKTEFSLNNETEFESGVFLSIVNGTFSIETPMGTTIRARIAANGTLLSIITGFLPSYENYTTGLVGKWNGNMEDDFTLPNGTVLPIDMSESEIFYRFGEEWRVRQEDILYRNINDDVGHFLCPNDFVPIFSEEALDSLDADLKREAEEICGNDVTCLFDIAATKQLSFGISTLSESTQIKNEIEILENQIPVFTQNLTNITVTLGQTFELILEATDADNDELTFDVLNIPPGANFTSNGNFLSFAWHVDSANEANVTFLVQDTKNTSSTLTPSIILCRCANGGECIAPEPTSDETSEIVSTFVVMSCICPVGRTGEFCEEITDFCAGDSTPPCHPLVTCINNPTNFTCGPCPTGYQGNGTICADIDECEDNTDECDQMCANSDGSYVCSCGDGFTLNQDGKRCNDIDECSQPNDCSQLCNNTIGSYDCYCRVGFKINETDPNQCAAETECPVDNKCAQICYVLEPGDRSCACRTGYALGQDQESCEDINECETTESNLCDHICTNTMGSYTCSCRDGYEQPIASRTSCTDIDECFEGNFTCPGLEECENLAGSYRCLCPERLNMVRVNGTCRYREDEGVVPDLAEDPPEASNEQRSNSIQITLKNFKRENYTIDVNIRFKDSVVKLVNDFCNQNRLRPADCGVSQNEILFNSFNVERLPGYPQNNGTDDAIIQFYVDYPSIVQNGSLPKVTLASIVFSELEKFQILTGFTIVLDTPVTPEVPTTPTDTQRANAVLLQILSFSISKWTVFYDTIFRRSIAVTLTRYCDIDDYSRVLDCEFSGSATSYDLTHVARIPLSLIDDGENVNVSFYVTNPSKSTPVPQKVLASMLLSQETDLEIALTQQVVLKTSAAPDIPPTATSDQRNNSVVIRISSFTQSRWTYLNDRRLRIAISNGIQNYCNESSRHLLDCQITGITRSFNESDVQRTSSDTPSNSVDNSIDYSFYVKYPNQNVPMVKYILASVVKFESVAMQSESALFFSLQTSFRPPPPATPTPDQSANTVQIAINNQVSNEWTAIDDNRFRLAVANQIQGYCSIYLVACAITSPTAFGASSVTRIQSSPVQAGNGAIYRLFVVYPSGEGPMQYNLLAGILTFQLEKIKNETSLDIQVNTSILAPSPPAATPDQISKSVTVNASSTQAPQWSAIQDNKFRGYVAQAIVEYCTGSAQKEECELSKDNNSFTYTHVQRVPGSPTQNGADADIQFYVNYPGGGTMSKVILGVIMSTKIDSIGINTKLSLSFEFTEPPTPPPPTPGAEENAISVLLKNFQANKWSSDRDALFRQNMAEQIKEFCNASTYHRTLCNITENDLNSLTSDNIQRLGNSPTQIGTDSNLTFYAKLPSDRYVPKSILATIFVAQQEKIFSINSRLEDQTDSFTPVKINMVQDANKVAISLVNFPIVKFTSLEVTDIKVTVSQIMNIFCFSTAENTCGITSPVSRRKKRAASTEFGENDVIVDTGSVMTAGNDTVVSVIVTEPGNDKPILADIVKDGLFHSIQDHQLSTISNLHLALVNVSAVSKTQRDNAISVRLQNTGASEWTVKDDISFRENMSKAIVQFCNMSDVHLDLCNVTSDQLAEIGYMNVKILPDSPNQHGTDAILSFFVDLPGGSTMPLRLLTVIFVTSPNVISQPTSLNATIITPNPDLTDAQRENLIELSINNATTQDVRLDIKVSIAHRLNEYCRTNSQDQLCPTTRNFTKDDILVHIENDAVSFVVIDPDSDTDKPLAGSQVRDAINGDFLSILYRLSLTVPTNPSEDEERDWPLILGLSIGGALLLGLFIMIIIYIVAWPSKSKKYEYNVDRREHRRDEGSWAYSDRNYGSWEFERDSPYAGSAFEGIEAIPGFDEDGLPTEDL